MSACTSTRLAVAAALGLAASTLVYAQNPATRAEQQAIPQLAPLEDAGTEIGPAPVIAGPFLEGEPQRLTMREVVLTTLAQNLDMKIVRKDRDVAAEEVWGAFGIYDPVVGARVARVRTDDQTVTILGDDKDDRAVIYTDATETQASISQRTPLGTQVTLQATDVREKDRDPFVFGEGDETVINATYDASLGLRVTQPLLKNFGPLVNNAEIRINQRALEGQNLAYREVIQERLAAVMTAYWDLDFAIRNLYVQRQALISADELLRVNRRRYEVGDLAHLGVAEAEAEVAQREFLVADAEAAVARAQDRLLALMNWKGGASNIEAWDQPILPADIPTYDPLLSLDDRKILEIALTKRPDYLQDKVRREITEIERAVARRQRLPELNLFAGYTIGGLEDQRSEAYETTFSGDYTGYNYGIEFRYPLFNRQARARHHIAEDRVEQADLLIESRELQIMTEVRNATRAYFTALDQIEATRRQVIADFEKVNSERKRLEVGEGTVFTVLDFQDDLAQSRANHVRALANYQIALIEIARASGILLDVQGVVVDDQESPRGWASIKGFTADEAEPVSTADEQAWVEMLRSLGNQ